MKRKIFGLLFVICLPLTTELVLPVGAAPCCSPVVRSTATYSGIGTSCAAAKADWKNQADIEAVSTCDSSQYCVPPVEVVTTACFWDTSCGAYRESGYIKYKCVPLACA
jgi:hypothetical protein